MNDIDVFISYPIHQRAWAETVVKRLEENGVRCWYSHRDLLMQRNYVSSLSEAIEACKVFLVLFDGDDSRLKSVASELQCAVNSSYVAAPKVFVPLRIGPGSLPEELRLYLGREPIVDAVAEPEDWFHDLWRFVEPAVGQRKTEDKVLSCDVFLSPCLGMDSLVSALADGLEKMGIVCRYAPRDFVKKDYTAASTAYINSCKVAVLLVDERANKIPGHLREAGLVSSLASIGKLQPITVVVGDTTELQMPLSLYLQAYPVLHARQHSVEEMISFIANFLLKPEKPVAVKPYSGDDPFIFVSYSHKDSDDVLPVILDLQRNGYRVWYDEGIDPGTEWDEYIAERIERCGYMFAFISRNYLDSDNCKDELKFARDLQKKRLLVYLENVKLPSGMAMRLNRLQAIHMYTYTSNDNFLQKLFAADGIDGLRER